MIYFFNRIIHYFHSSCYCCPSHSKKNPTLQLISSYTLVRVKLRTFLSKWKSNWRTESDFTI